ncbi:hypothetical protein BGX23_010261 [Mortierella sp. AD031]|nr:hypothetical protein BGX23_010261 [Mortierella sp. AD031]
MDQFLASPFVSSNSLSSALLGVDLSPSAATIRSTAATIADAPMTAATTPTTIATTSTTFSSSSTSSFPRSRATDLLLNLEASSNDSRFQEILHNTIALDLFRQFCFQEYSIENLLFWMDVELFAKPNLELQHADRLKYKILQRRLEKQQRAYRNKESTLDEKQQQQQGHDGGQDGKEKSELEDEEIERLKREVEEEDAQFAVQHARYIYLTYVDSNAPLQVNLSDESRTEIPWPLLDAGETNDSRSRNNSGNSSNSTESKRSNKSRTSTSEDGVVGWPLDRHMFDGAQEHTYQLMKGHTLVRFEDSELWKSVLGMMHEQPEMYAKAMVQGPLHSQYCPDTSVIVSTVARSRSRHPTAKRQTLYNWNNSTTDLDRSRDKEEALAKTMSQYFGPIPPSIRHPGRVILGLGPRHGDEFEDDDDDEFDDFDTYEDMNRSGPLPTTMMTESKRSSANSSIRAGIGGGFRKNRFTKRLSGGIGGRNKSQHHHSNASDELVSGGDLYDDSYSLDHHDVSGIDSVANGRRTTRWMVAGYFNDQVRLTAAQRKRLLRRNNKLTKFFGSRVDGTLRPVEETEDGGFIVPPTQRSSMTGGINAAAGVAGVAGSAPTLGSPLAYALSSSTIHDMDRKGRPKKNKSKRDSGNGHEVLFMLPGSKSSAGGSSRSMNILQKFKRSSGEYYDGGRSSLFLNTTGRKSASQDDVGTSSAGSVGSGSRHVRSLTSVDGQPPIRRILAAHPHPLWSGSLSDQEVDNPANYERRRQLSILSIMGNLHNNNSSTSPHSPNATGLTPTTPTGGGLEFYTSPRGLDQDGVSSPMNRPTTAAGGGAGPLDRQAMYTRRKKADKLSTFFGAQLTAQELSSQLRMEDDFGLVSTASQSQKKMSGEHPLQRSLSDGDKHNKAEAAITTTTMMTAGMGGPSALSVNQLSNRDRTLLWKRNKKLRGILGESLQESEVALSLTMPVLSTRSRNSMSSSRRPSAGGSPALRKKRDGHVKQASSETRTGVDGDNDEEEGEGEGDSEGYEDLNSSSNLVRHKAGKASKTRIRRTSATATTAGIRARRPSVASTASSRQHHHHQHQQHGRLSRAGSFSGLGSRAMSIHSLDSFQAVDPVLHKDLDEDDEDLDADVDLEDATVDGGVPRYAHRRRTSSIRPYGYSHLSPRYRQIHAAAGSDGGTNTTATAEDEAMTRINRKKRMDKIQQFLGDRVPEHDLWIGTVGREKTREMLEKNLLSPTSPTFPNLEAAGVGAGIGSIGGGASGLYRSATVSRLGPKFKKAAFPGRSKTITANTYKGADLSFNTAAINEKESAGGQGEAVKRWKQRPVVVTTGNFKRGVKMERSFSDPPRLEDGSGTGAGAGLGIRSPGVHQHPYQWHTTASRLRQQLASPVTSPTSTTATGDAIGVHGGSAPSPSVSPRTSFSSSAMTSPRMGSSFGGVFALPSTSSGSTTNNTTTATSPTTTVDFSTSTTTAATTPNITPKGVMMVLHDEEGDDSDMDINDSESAAQILPQLRAMSGKDQERFLKRAEKLERLFGRFPPSALLHQSLTTATSAEGIGSTTSLGGGEVVKDGGQGKTEKKGGSGGGEMVELRDTRETSIVQLAAFLASTTTTAQNSSSSPPSLPIHQHPSSSAKPIAVGYGGGESDASEGGRKWTSEMMEALAEVERMSFSSEENDPDRERVLDSLGIAATMSAGPSSIGAVVE